ncbi:hypothetical protein [Streptomyces sp. SID9727]|uniref:hypothetical protein n=1 Tax=Streptomyces sp. SID9727 TaxID=2706114 RepID=UPI0013C69617|nr:hypothetical protein [Streptomyces sp. SID9727]NEC64377.1 hypothetical protein [Streptomyces sp. SID9727]
MSYAGGDSDDADDGGIRMDARASGRARVTMAGRDVSSTYFVSVSSAVVLALAGLVVLVALWQPWQKPGGGDDDKPASVVSEPVSRPPHRDPPPDSRDDEEEPDADGTTSPPTPSPSPTPTPTPTPDPPNPVDLAFASVRAGTCLNVFDAGWGKLNHDRPEAVDCAASYAFTQVTMVTTAAGNCPEGAGRRSWGHVNSDGSSVALCLDRRFASGQCFPASLTKQADGSIKGTGMLFTVWGCDQTKVPKGQNALMVITALVSDGQCPQRTGRKTLSWTVFSGSRTLCAVQVQR